MSASAIAAAGAPSGSTRQAADSTGAAPGAGDPPTDLFQDLMQSLSAAAGADVVTSNSHPTALSDAFAGAENTLLPAVSTDTLALPPELWGLGLVFAQSLATLPTVARPTVGGTAQDPGLPQSDSAPNATRPVAGGATRDPLLPIQSLLDRARGDPAPALAAVPSGRTASVPADIKTLVQRPPAQEQGALNALAATAPVAARTASSDWSTTPQDAAAKNQAVALDTAPQPPATATPDVATSFHLSAPNAVDTPGIYRNTLQSLPTSPAFPAELVSQVRFLTQGGLQQAELQMNPVELGPIQIELRLNADVADIGFTAAHAATREGIAQSLPQLREMLGSQGLSLGQTSVGAESQSQQQTQQERLRPDNAARANNGETSSAHIQMPVGTGTLAARGLLDLYA